METSPIIPDRYSAYQPRKTDISFAALLEQCEKLEHLLADSRSKVKTLQDTLNTRSHLSRFSSLRSTQPVVSDLREAGTLMHTMGYYIKTLVRPDIEKLCRFSPAAERSDLTHIIHRAFPYADGTQGHPALKTITPQNLRLGDLVRTLVAAALCCWVFDSPLNFLNNLCNSSACPLSQEYRKCLAAQGMLVQIRSSGILISM